MVFGAVRGGKAKAMAHFKSSTGGSQGRVVEGRKCGYLFDKTIGESEP